MPCARTAAVLGLGFLGALPSHAQQDCQHRTIPVSVARNDDVPVPPLSSANFEGKYRGKAVRVSSVTLNEDPPRVVMLLEVSASMQYPRSNWDLMLDVAEDVLSRAPQASEIGLASFSDELEVLTHPTTDRKTLMGQMENLRSRASPSKKKTALWDAIADGVRMIDRPRPGDAIYLISDNEDSKSKATSNYVGQTLEETGVRLFELSFQRLETFLGPGSAPVKMLQLGEDTGGRLIGFNFSILGSNGYLVMTPDHNQGVLDKSGKPTWLGLHLRSQYRQIFSFYRVDVDLPETVDKPREWKLDLVGFGRSERENLVLKYPRVLVPCH